MSRTLLLLLTVAILVASCSGDQSATVTTTADASPQGPTVPDQMALESNASVERVVDGDTIIADIGGTSERVRLLGIDTPESVAETRPDQCFGAEASDYLKSVLPPGTKVTLIRDEEPRDQYDRLLAYVVRSDDQLFVNLDLLERGFAGVMIYPPNDHYADLFTDAEEIAASNDIGLWGICGGPDVPLE